MGNHLPRVAITFCTQCKWMLRAAYFGQELLSTFGTAIGEVALIPATGGLFQVHLTYVPDGQSNENAKEVLLWDRKAEGGFPETKILKQLVRNLVEPQKNLGHSDTPSKAGTRKEQTSTSNEGLNDVSKQETPPLAANSTDVVGNCEDCK